MPLARRPPADEPSDADSGSLTDEQRDFIDFLIEDALAEVLEELEKD